MSSVNKRVIKDIQDGTIALKADFGISIAPEEDNMYRVHFLLPGPEDTPFEGGLYHGMIRLNDNHPLSAPNIHMITPSGRFKPETCPIPNGSRGICPTTSSFHPECWTPVNNITTILEGLISLMCDLNDVGIGGLRTSAEEIKKLAGQSYENIKQDAFVKQLFPEIYDDIITGKYKPIKLSELSTSKQLVTPIVEALVIPEEKSAGKKKIANKNISKKSSRKKPIDSDSEEDVPKKSSRKKPIDSDSEEDVPEKPSRRKPINTDSEEDIPKKHSQKKLIEDDASKKRNRKKSAK
jgi:ubiquitin-protein ligase